MNSNTSNGMNLEKIVRWGLYACALIPLVIFKEFLSPFHFGKVVVFRTLVEIIAIFYVALILQDRSFLPKPTKLFWAMTLFTGVFGLTTLTSVYPYQSFVGTLERMGGWFSFIHLWAMFVMMISVLRTREHWITLVKISVLASLLSTVYGFLQKGTFSWVVGATDRERIFGTLGNTALFAGYTIVSAFLAFLLVPLTKSMQRWLFLFIGLINVVAVLMTVVRGSLLALVVSLGCFCVLILFSEIPNKSIGYGLLGLLAIVVAMEFFLIANRESDWVRQSNFLSRIAHVSLSGRTVQTRFWAWQAGIDGWNDSVKTMIVGWGPENFNVPFAKHFNPRFFAGIGSETLFDRAHNMFVEVLVTMGLVGFASYLGIFAVMFWMAWKLYRSKGIIDRISGAIILAGIVAYMIHNAFIFDTSANFIVFFLFAGMLQFLYYQSGSEKPVQRSPMPVATTTTMRYSLTALLAFVVAFSVYKTNIVPAIANYDVTRGIVASWDSKDTEALDYFNKALRYDTSISYELRHRYAQYVLENVGSFADQKLDAGKILLAMIEEVKKNLSSPLDYLPYLYISRGYIVLGKSDPNSPFNDLAVQYSTKALEISPTFVRTYFEVAQAYLNKDDYENAIKMFQKAVDLNPEVGLSWWYLGATQLDAKDIDGGLKSIKKAAELGYVLSEGELVRIIDPLVAAKRYDVVINILEDLIKLQPNNASYYARLSAVYAQVGRISDAVAAAKKTAALDPKSEAEARAFVKQIGGTW